MDFLIILLAILILWGIRPMCHNSDYIGRESTTAIKGIFAILILFSHSRQYLVPPPIENQLFGDGLFVGLLDFLGQLIVVMFLTYSGYGIMESVKRKGDSYKKGFMRKRVFKTLLHFDIAVALFLIIALYYGYEYSIDRYLLCWTGWLSIGNSNWFIFDIIVLYLLTYGGLIITGMRKGSIKHFAWIVTGLSACFTLLMIKAKHGQLWWADTIMSFPIGMLWSAYKTQLEKYLSDMRRYIIMFTTILILFCVFHWAGKNMLAVFHIVSSMLFAILVILLTMKLRLGNPVLHWLGVNAFAIYILQRIPMIIAKETGLHQQPFLFMSVVIPVTLLIAAIFTAATNRLDKKYLN